MKKILIFLFLSLFALTSVSFALNNDSDYSASSFEAAQEAGKMIVVDVYKDGCGTCASQKPSVEKAQGIYPDAQFFHVNFSKDKEAVAKFKAVKPGTIIVFKGSEETGRLIGETREAQILAKIQTGA